MCKSIDLKSVVIGGLVVALVICAVGAVRFAQTDTYGRFELTAGPDFTFLLDTATGQVWSVQTGFSDGVIVTPPHTSEEFYAPKTYDTTPIEPNWP